MKKLMIAAAIVCAAVFANAANVDWKWTSTLYDHANSDAAYNGTVYIINANSYSQQTVLDALLAGGDLASYNMGSGVATSNGKAPSGYSTITTDASSFAPTRTVGSDKYIDFFYAALTTGTDGKDYVFLSSSYYAGIDSTADTHLSKSLSSSKTGIDGATFSAQGWYLAESVPEPSSGLLLLLGIAGLALRRKQK